MAAALGSLKGPRHGGANIKVVRMFDDMKATIDTTDDAQIRDYLARLLDKNAFDRAGLIYGMGHAVYSLSDPRSEILKGYAKKLAEAKGMQEEFDLYEASYRENAVRAFRVNTEKISVKDFAEIDPFSSEPIPYVETGFYLNYDKVGNHPFHHAGMIYVQDPGAMATAECVEVEPDWWILDMCAAPGGKSTHLLSVLPHGSLLVSNEPMPLRAQILAENVTKWGYPASMVTKNMPADFAPFREFLDFMLVDAPCSGEGMFRKEPKAVEQWSVSNVQMCADRQKEILASIWPSLRPGGLLVYSTCTFNSEENEENVRWVADELGAEVLELEISSEWGIVGSLVKGVMPVYRFIPGATEGEGLFLAVLRKNGDGALAQPRQPRLQKPSAKIKDEVAGFLQNPELFDFVQDGDAVTAMPKEHTSAMMALQQRLCVLHCGLPLVTIKNNKLLPVHSLAMSTALRKETFCVVELELEQALRYLHRETLSLPSLPMGFILLTYRNVPIGFVKNVGNRANNLYPAEWRIRKNLLDL